MSYRTAIGIPLVFQILMMVLISHYGVRDVITDATIVFLNVVFTLFYCKIGEKVGAAKAKAEEEYLRATL